MKLITELIENVEYLEEDGGGERRLYIQGPFLQFDVINKNQRKYSSEICEPEVQRYIKEMVDQDRAYGELGHPDGPRINLDRASHLIKELNKNGSTYVGKALIMEETPMGKIAAGIIHAGGRLGASSRALGSVKMIAGINEVQKDFKLATAADIVADPSASGAFVNGIMEGVEYFYDSSGNWKIQESLDDIKKGVHNLPKKQLNEETFLKIWNNFMDKITNVKF